MSIYLSRKERKKERSRLYEQKNAGENVSPFFFMRRRHDDGYVIPVCPIDLFVSDWSLRYPLLAAIDLLDHLKLPDRFAPNHSLTVVCM